MLYCIKDGELELRSDFILLRPRPPYFVFCSSAVRVPPADASPLETPARHSTCGTAPGSGRQSQQPTHRGRGGKTNTPLSWVGTMVCLAGDHARVVSHDVIMKVDLSAATWEE